MEPSPSASSKPVIISPRYNTGMKFRLSHRAQTAKHPHTDASTAALDHVGNQHSQFKYRILSRLCHVIHARRPGETPAFTPAPTVVTGEAAADLIGDWLTGPAPCMIARFGAVELVALQVYLRKMEEKPWLAKAATFLDRPSKYFWWSPAVTECMRINAGFFPITDENLDRFGQLMLRDIREIDLLRTWLAAESEVARFMPTAQRVIFNDLSPTTQTFPWTNAIRGKKILVVHPFETSIRNQYARRTRLFQNPDALPEFELLTLKAVQSLAGQKVPYATWFEALDAMCEQMEQIDFDIAFFGAGAYGLPLAAHAKRIGKKAVHLGGSLQLMFGIKGKRWDTHPVIAPLYNEHWVRPLPEELPANANAVENGCYW